MAAGLTALKKWILAGTVACTLLQAFNGVFTANLYSDEATSLIASKAIISTGFPQTPTGLIYWRSPVSHYLTAASIFMFGDSEFGWRAVSFFSFALLVVGIAFFAFKQLGVMSAIFAVIMLRDSGPLQAAAGSARMYMLFAAEVAWILVQLQKSIQHGSIASKKASWPFWAISCAAAFTHEYFVIVAFAALAALWCDKPSGIKTFLRRGHVHALVTGAVLAVWIHFVDPYLPRSWTNPTSGTAFAFQRTDFNFILEWIEKTLFLPSVSRLLLIPLAAVWLLDTPGVADRRALRVAGRFFAIFSCVLYGSVSILLPAFSHSYAVPMLVPCILAMVWTMTAVRGRSRILAASLVIAYLAFTHHTSKTVFPELTIKTQSKNATRWRLVLDALKSHPGSLLFSSEPEIPYLRTAWPVNEVRTSKVPFSNSCLPTLHEFYGTSYVHHACAFKEMIRAAPVKALVIVTGQRLTSTSLLDDALQSNIQEGLRLGTIEHQRVYCRPIAECLELKSRLDQEGE